MHDSSFANLPMLANVIFQYPCECGFTPFVGGGLGTSISVLNADDIIAGGSVVDGSDVDVYFGPASSIEFDDVQTHIVAFTFNLTF